MNKVLPVSPSLQTLQQARNFINDHKKLVLGVAGIASIAAIFFFRSKRDDTPVFERALTELNAVEEQAVGQMSRLPLADMPRAADLLKDSTLPIWQTFRQQVKSTERLKLDKTLEQKRTLLVDYANLRVKQSKLLYSAFKENTNAYDEELNLVYNDINNILAELQH